MNPFYLTLLSVLCLLLTSLPMKAQDATYSQYQANWITVNPSLTGFHEGTTIQALRRDQWVPVQNRRSRFTNNSFSMATHIPCLNSSFGVFYNDNTEGEGALRKSGFGASYAYLLDLTGKQRDFVSSLRLGLSGTYRQNELDWERLVFYGQLDPIFGIVSQQNLPRSYQDASFINYMDYAAGATYHYYSRTKNVGLRLGAAAHHINKPQQSLLGADDLRLPWRWTAHGSLTLENFRSPALMVVPAFKIDMQKAATRSGVFSPDPDAFMYRSLSLGVFFALLPTHQYEKRYATGQGWFIGVWGQSRNLFPDTRNTFNLIGILGFAVKRPAYNYNLALSYEANLWGVGAATGGALELSLTFNFPEMSACTSYKRPPWWCGKYPSPLYF